MSLDFVNLRQLTILLSFFILGLTQGIDLQAQVNAPEFLCVQNDTLRWNVPINTCGAFNAYLIHSSLTAAGPYSLLATITDPAQTAYFHDGAGNQTWYYYLEADVDCPGQPILKSDTLNNRIPDTGPIQVVTVENAAAVRVDWTASPSPQVIGYIISRQNTLGTTILDTIYNGLTYMDTGANPAEQSETYFVVALDPCGNVSLVPDPHRTIFLEIVAVDSCSQEVLLRWSDYINWPDGVLRYEILAAQASSATNPPGPYTVVGAVEGSVTEYTFSGAEDGQTFFFKIQAVAAESMEVSFSNETSVEIGIVQAVQDLVIAGLEVAPDQIAVRWVLQPDIPLTTAALFRSENGTDFSQIADINAPDELYTDITNLGYSKSLTYRIEAVDQCGNEIISNAASTIFISGQPGRDSENELNWTPYFNEAGQLVNYEFYRIIGNANSLQTVYNQGELRHIDPIDLTDPSQASVCYQVIANANINLSDQVITGVRSSSNILCMEQSAKLFVPNAFVPNGVNREFKPVLQFGGSQDYLMTIYDRYGGVLFESRELTAGWDGSKNGRPLPQGMYVYLIKMTQNNGNVIEKKGTVLLLR